MKEIHLHHLPLLQGIILSQLDNATIKIGKILVLKISIRMMKQSMIIVWITMMESNCTLINKLETANNLEFIFIPV